MILELVDKNSLAWVDKASMSGVYHRTYSRAWWIAWGDRFNVGTAFRKGAKGRITLNSSTGIYAIENGKTICLSVPYPALADVLILDRMWPRWVELYGGYPVTRTPLPKTRRFSL